MRTEPRFSTPSIGQTSRPAEGFSAGDRLLLRITAIVVLISLAPGALLAVAIVLAVAWPLLLLLTLVALTVVIAYVRLGLGWLSLKMNQRRARHPAP